MRVVQQEGIIFYDLQSPPQDFRDEVLRGLTRAAKSLPAKFFYDDLGARLFEQICELPEYYPTRTETAILRSNAEEIAALLGKGCRLIEFGSGAGTKIRILLDHLESPAAYLPIDVAKTQLVETAVALSESYPTLDVLPICADYMGEIELPEPSQPVARTAAFFPGSTIGNLEPDDAARFLLRVARLCGDDGALLIGVDLQKDPAILEPAYNDAAGVTAAFNLNMLRHVNRELGAAFDLTSFRHHAFYDQEKGRIEMQLVSLRAQTVNVAGVDIPFQEGEHITTEYSYKYTLDGFRGLAERSGFSVAHVWLDPQKLFSVQFLRTQDGAHAR